MNLLLLLLLTACNVYVLMTSATHYWFNYSATIFMLSLTLTELTERMKTHAMPTHFIPPERASQLQWQASLFFAVESYRLMNMLFAVKTLDMFTVALVILSLACLYTVRWMNPAILFTCCYAVCNVHMLMTSQRHICINATLTTLVVNRVGARIIGFPAMDQARHHELNAVMAVSALWVADLYRLHDYIAQLGQMGQPLQPIYALCVFVLAMGNAKLGWGLIKYATRECDGDAADDKDNAGTRHRNPQEDAVTNNSETQ